MKKFILFALFGIAAASTLPASAQINVSVNLGSQPQWGPKGHNYVDYYYLPEVQSYYHVPSKEFIYRDKNKWVHRKSLPTMYRNYNLYQGRKVVINQPNPYLHHERYYAKYSKQKVKYKKAKHYDKKHKKHDYKKK